MRNIFSELFPAQGKANPMALEQTQAWPDGVPDQVPVQPETGQSEGASQASEIPPNVDTLGLPGSAPPVDLITNLPMIPMGGGPVDHPGQAGGGFDEDHPGEPDFLDDIFM